MTGRNRRRQRDVFCEAWERFSPEVFRYLAVLLGCRAQAEDVTQEVFLRLWPVARRDPSALECRAYVLRTARNEAWRRLAKERGQPNTTTDGLLEIHDPRQGSETERVAIEEALLQLPHEQREVIHLKTYARMTFSEIAQMTDVSQNTAASRYRYAVEKLRELLADEEE